MRSTPCGDVIEFPPLVDRRFGQNMPMVGWGLRMTAPGRVLRVIEDRNTRGIPVALAVHPWEIDPDPPRVRLPRARRFAHYFRLDGFRTRLDHDPARRRIRAHGRSARALSGLHMTLRARLAMALAALLLLAPARGLAADATLRGIAIDQRLDAQPLPADLPRIAPTIVRLADRRDRLHRSDRGRDRSRVCRIVLDLYRSRDMTVVLALGSIPAADADVEPWRQFVRDVAERAAAETSSAIRSATVQAGAMPDVEPVRVPAEAGGRPDPVGRLRRARPAGRHLPAPEVDWQGRVLAAGAGPYVDGLAIDGPPAADDEPFRSAVERMVALIEREQPSAAVLLGPVALPADAAAATSRLVDAVLQALGTPIGHRVRG